MCVTVVEHSVRGYEPGVGLEYYVCDRRQKQRLGVCARGGFRVLCVELSSNKAFEGISKVWVSSIMCVTVVKKSVCGCEAGVGLEYYVRNCRQTQRLRVWARGGFRILCVQLPSKPALRERQHGMGLEYSVCNRRKKQKNAFGGTSMVWVWSIMYVTVIKNSVV